MLGVRPHTNGPVEKVSARARLSTILPLAEPTTLKELDVGKKTNAKLIWFETPVQPGTIVSFGSGVVEE